MGSKAALYGISQSKHNRANKSAYESSSSTAFASTLSTLLTGSSESAPVPRSRQPKSAKDDIFKVHNKGSKKRALADISGSGAFEQKHSESSEAIDVATLSRSRRKLEQKARLYADMRRGEYAPPSDGHNKEAESLVDFDRKWAEQEDKFDVSSSSDDYDDDAGRQDGSEELIEYEDEMGRTRKGTKAEVAKILRQRNAAAYAAEELSSFSARPARPANLITGDTIQSAAFNPDAPVAAQMEDLARKRDRSMTPPEAVHYDATKEIRTKGVGFYQFSRDNKDRQQEMESLEKEREQTEALRRERGAAAEKKTADVTAKEKIRVAELNKQQADQFLDSLQVG